MEYPMVVSVITAQYRDVRNLDALLPGPSGISLISITQVVSVGTQ